MPERFLEGRTALVTGSVQGIGLAIGKALASADLNPPLPRCQF
jgi:3-hydroxybutyrate dehydrogenase